MFRHGEMAQHDLHQGVLEPDAGCEHRRGLVAAARDPFGLARLFPRRRCVQGEQFGWEVVGGVVDGDVPLDFLDWIVGMALVGAAQISTPTSRRFERNAASQHGLLPA